MVLRVSCAAASAALLLMAPGMASAATEVFTATVPQDGSFTVGSFDLSLGTLTGVTLQLDTIGSVSITIFNPGDPGASFTHAQTQVSEVVTGPGGPLANTYTATSVGGIVPVGPFAVEVLPPVTVTDNLTAPQASGVFAAFETNGAGTISYNSQFGPTFTSSITTSGPLGVSGTGALQSGSFTVTYDYTAAAVPEPAGWALMILGFGGLGSMLRRRRTALA